MTTVTIARKGDQVAICADSLVTFGDTRLSGDYEANEKIFMVGDTYFGFAGTAAHFPVMRSLLDSMKDQLQFHSREQVFNSFVAVHAQLKEKYFLNTKEEDDDPYESSQIICLLANASGIYGVYSYREVFSFDKFWAIGSGRNYALGAMHTMYAKAKNAGAVAQAGVQAGCEFDKNSSLPLRTFTVDLVAG